MKRPPLRLGENTWDWSRPYLLGVLNLTPDSFSDGGRYDSVEAAVERAMAMEAEGADAIDLGGESTRPGAASVSLKDELARIIPVVLALRGRVRVPLSVDTMRAEVARQAIKAGAHIVNDVGMGDSPEAMGAVARAGGVAYIAMHSRGTPATMVEQASYAHVGRDVAAELLEFVRRLEDAGVDHDRILVDPGIGFAKTARQSIELLADLAPVAGLGYAVCVGPSRKSFIAARDAYASAWLADAVPPSRERLGGTAAAVTACVLQGVEVLRVHDVAVMRQTARVAHALAGAWMRHA